MSKYGNQTFKNKFINALNGFKIQLTRQQSTKRQLWGTFIFIIFAVLLKFNSIEYCLLGIIITTIFMAEFINSTIEYIQDALFGNEYSEIAKISKDMAAGIVLYAFMMAVITGAFLYIPKIIQLIKLSGKHVIL